MTLAAWSTWRSIESATSAEYRFTSCGMKESYETVVRCVAGKTHGMKYLQSRERTGRRLSFRVLNGLSVMAVKLLMVLRSL